MMAPSFSKTRLGYWISTNWRHWRILFSDTRIFLALAIIFATLVFAWMFRWEHLSQGALRNRFTGTVCYRTDINC